jgi:hypothetical protein
MQFYITAGCRSLEKLSGLDLVLDVSKIASIAGCMATYRFQASDTLVCM